MSNTASHNNAESAPQQRPIRFVHNQGQPSKRRRINAAYVMGTKQQEPMLVW
jgi:hypothetical protein